MAEMKDIQKLDGNFAVGTGSMEGMDVYTVDHGSMELSGFYWRGKGGKFRRFPEDMDLTFNPGVESLSWCTAGGHVRFRSNATEIRIHAVTSGGRMCHMAQVGSRGFDLYVGRNHTEVFAKSARFDLNHDEYTSTLYSSPNAILRDFTI